MTIKLKAAALAAIGSLLGAVATQAHAATLTTNSGFESGTAGWTFSSGSGTATVTSDYANSGIYSAALTGNDSSISQTISATAVSTISEFTLYAMSDSGAYDEVVFMYSDGTTSTGVVFGLGDEGWTQYDLASYLESGETLVGFAIYGALDQTNYIDDVTLSAVSTVPEPAGPALMFAGLACIGWLGHRRSRATMTERALA